MGPEDTREARVVPSCLRLTWDSKTVPFLNGLWDYFLYGKAVRHWSVFLDKKDDTNFNKVAKNQHGIVLLSNLYGRVADLCKSN